MDVQEVYGADNLRRALFDLERAKLRIITALDGCAPGMVDAQKVAEMRGTFLALTLAQCEVRTAQYQLDRAILSMRCFIDKWDQEHA